MKANYNNNKKLKEKDIQLIAEKIIEIENKTKEEKGTLDKTNSSYIAEIEELIRNLSMTDLFRIDDYIMSRKLLTK
ncbi:MAG: hypothetical protein SPI36_04160 [Candidatus Onthovivens sp.]|nr:hypothetical protein [Candidatus Onthovivens sp.]